MRREREKGTGDVQPHAIDFLTLRDLISLLEPAGTVDGRRGDCEWADSTDPGESLSDELPFSPATAPSRGLERETASYDVFGCPCRSGVGEGESNAEVRGCESSLSVAIMRSRVLSIKAGTSAVVRPVVGMGGSTGVSSASKTDSRAHP